MAQAKLDGNVSRVVQFVEQIGDKDWKEMNGKIKQYGYQTAIIKDEKVVDGYNGEQMIKLAHSLKGVLKEGTEVYYHQEATIVTKYLSNMDGYLVAVRFPKDEWWINTLNRSFQTFLLAFFIIGICTIFVLLFLASFFTRRMNRTIMEPLEKLINGVKRIQAGNLNEEIHYQGDAEFETVCKTFNDMQRMILEDREQRVKNQRARTDMVTGISHDLRTPLTSIQGYIKGVLDGVANTEEKQRLYLKTAYESTEEMNVLLKKLFDFSRMESGQMPFHMICGDLVEYTVAYVAQKEAVLESDQVQFAFEQERELMPEIRMDVDQVRRIYDNLLENSMKYVKERPIRIQIRVFKEENYLVLEWKDNGQGVPEEKIGRIFERFYRCDESRNEKSSGVGLYVVQYIMKQHKGYANAQNADGLQIRLYFPREE